MEIRLILGGVLFCLHSERRLFIDLEIVPFLTAESKKADIEIKVSWDWGNARRAKGEPVGEDLLQTYFEENGAYYCETRAGIKGPIASTFYTDDFSEVICTINEKPFLEPPKTLGSILRMLPMRQIFQHFGTLFFHASQISCKGRGILFMAPSGGGKSTQAKLWKRYREAEIVCNDRTLIKRQEEGWKTYGYPIDGSEPVRSSQVNSLGGVVLLKKGAENNVQELEYGKAISLLIRQVVMDCWSSAARSGAMEMLISLLKEIPVFLLTCTPDECAVTVLERKLIEEGVIADG